MRQALRKELIGRSIEVVESKNRCLVGIRGMIIDETKNTLRVQTDAGRKTLLKHQVVFVTGMKNGKVKIDGSKIVKRPEKRTGI